MATEYRQRDGEGANALPDEYGGRWTGNDCTTEPKLPMRQVILGNLHVRG